MFNEEFNKIYLFVGLILLIKYLKNINYEHNYL